jgi:hypothetical protein
MVHEITLRIEKEAKPEIGEGRKDPGAPAAADNRDPLG